MALRVEEVVVVLHCSALDLLQSSAHVLHVDLVEVLLDVLLLLDGFERVLSQTATTFFSCRQLKEILPKYLLSTSKEVRYEWFITVVTLKPSGLQREATVECAGDWTDGSPACVRYLLDFLVDRLQDEQSSESRVLGVDGVEVCGAGLEVESEVDLHDAVELREWRVRSSRSAGRWGGLRLGRHPAGCRGRRAASKATWSARRT